MLLKELGVGGDPQEGGKPLSPGNLASQTQSCSGLTGPPSPEMWGWAGGADRRRPLLHLLWPFPRKGEGVVWGPEVGSKNQKKKRKSYLSEFVCVEAQCGLWTPLGLRGDSRPF